MEKRVIIITGTPRVGKTSAARLLASKLNSDIINLTDLATKENLVSGRDTERNTIIIDEAKMRRRLDEIVEESEKQNLIIDGHYAVNVISPELITQVFVLRRDPVELRKFMQDAGFTDSKLDENLASEILDVCLVEALNVAGRRKVCELDVTGKTVEDTVKEMLFLLSHPDNCRVGIVDWLGKLEKEGILQEYMKG